MGHRGDRIVKGRVRDVLPAPRCRSWIREKARTRSAGKERGRGADVCMTGRLRVTEAGEANGPTIL